MNTKQVKELTGLTDDQISYLIKKVDALKREKTQGKAREYSYRDLVYLKLASLMRSDGLGSDEINLAMKVLNQNWTDRPEGALLRFDYVKRPWLMSPYSIDPADKFYPWMWSSKASYVIFDPKSKEFKESDIQKHIPGFLYNVEYFASELARRDQLELDFDIMSEARVAN